MKQMRKLLAVENSEFFVLKGHHENSPAFQRRVVSAEEIVPKGRLNGRQMEISAVPSELTRRALSPGVETQGYSRMSLRDAKKVQNAPLQSWAAFENFRVRLSLRLISVFIALLCFVFTSSAQESKTKIHFEAVDIFVDSGAKPLAAYQLEFRVENGDAKIVGVEGGSHAAFREPPFYDPKAIQQERVILAAFNTSAAEKLPKNKTRVATIHLRIDGSKELEFSVKLKTVASVNGKKISGETTFETKEK